MKLIRVVLWVSLVFLLFVSIFHPFYLVLSGLYVAAIGFEATYLRRKGAVQVPGLASRFGVQRRTAKKRRDETDK